MSIVSVHDIDGKNYSNDSADLIFNPAVFGVELDMGTPYNSVDRNIRTKAKVNKNAQVNRKLLYKIMKKQRFVNYPNEWWHFCYGDRMWTAYSGKKTCPYGMVE